MPQAGVPNLSRMQEATNVATKTKRELTLKDRLSRLTALKDRWDPTNFFRLNANIPPTTAS